MRLRAVARIARAVLHGLHGVAIVVFEFPRLEAGERHTRIAGWSRKMLRCIGVALQVDGAPAAGAKLLVVNHVSWLDILAIHAVVPEARFVSKADVKGWPLLARLIDSAGTIYLERERKRDALRVAHAMAEALKAGATVAVFPEGTTSTGHGLLLFHANLLQAAVATGTPVQPAALRYADATHAVSEAVEFVGATTLLASLWGTAQGERIAARLSFLPPRPAAGRDRRELAAELHADIAAALGGFGPGNSR